LRQRALETGTHVADQFASTDYRVNQSAILNGNAGPCSYLSMKTPAPPAPCPNLFRGPFWIQSEVGVPVSEVGLRLTVCNTLEPADARREPDDSGTLPNHNATDDLEDRPG
jgi:hypothetical protein